MEALSLNKVQQMSIEHPWDRTFMKLFNTFDKQIVQQCQHYSGCLPLYATIDIRKIEFYKKLLFTENNFLIFLYNQTVVKETLEIAKRYDYESNLNTFLISYRDIVTTYVSI